MSAGSLLVLDRLHLINGLAPQGGSLQLQPGAKAHLINTSISQCRAVGSAAVCGALHLLGGVGNRAIAYLSNGTVMQDNTAGAPSSVPTSSNVHIDDPTAASGAAGAVYYLLPAPAGRWISAGVTCERVAEDQPCTSEPSCNEDTSHDCDPYCDVLPTLTLAARLYERLPLGRTARAELPDRCPAGHFGS